MITDQQIDRLSACTCGGTAEPASRRISSLPNATRVDEAKFDLKRSHQMPTIVQGTRVYPEPDGWLDPAKINKPACYGRRCDWLCV